MARTPVYLNVYDLTDYNSYVHWCGTGVYHAGVEVYNTEYAYGGHEYDYTGIFATRPKDAPGQVIFRESVYVGDTDYSQDEIHQLMLKMGQEYKGNRYHLLQRNCNHFASDVVYQLTGHHAPQWINRLAGLAVMLHCLLPSTWVPPLQSPLDQTIESRQSLIGQQGRSDAYAMDRGPQVQSSIVTPPMAAPSSGLLANRA